MRRSTALLAVSGLFLAGVLVGVLATHAFYAYQIHQPGGLATISLRLLSSRLESQLDLSEEQQRQVDAILADTRGELTQVRHEMVPRLYAIRGRAFDRVAAVLTPEQREELVRFRARHEKNVSRIVGE